MSRLFEVEGTYGSGRTPSTILCYEQRSGTWYCCVGSQNVNCTTDPIEDGVDIEELRDHDYFHWTDPIETLDQLEEAVDA